MEAAHRRRTSQDERKRFVVLLRILSVLRSDEIVIARSHRASKDARPSTGYGDAAI
jgi:hypothetical protein